MDTFSHPRKNKHCRFYRSTPEECPYKVGINTATLRETYGEYKISAFSMTPNRLPGDLKAVTSCCLSVCIRKKQLCRSPLRRFCAFLFCVLYKKSAQWSRILVSFRRRVIWQKTVRKVSLEAVAELRLHPYTSWLMEVATDILHKNARVNMEEGRRIRREP